MIKEDYWSKIVRYDQNLIDRNAKIADLKLQIVQL
jgi:hypothetical protein